MSYPVRLFSIAVVSAVTAAACARLPVLPWHDKSVAAITSQSLETFDSADDLYDYMRALDKRQYRPPPPKNKDEGVIEEIIVGATKAVAVVTVATLQKSSINDLLDLQSVDSGQITNVQEKGVDEGDIVKRFNRFLIILKDGRLFSIDTGTTPGALTLTDRVDLYEDADTGTWYDEMLITGNHVLVTAYNYESDATEITVVSIDEMGAFELTAKFYIESDDYYSYDNYSSRLVNGQLVLYTSLGSSFFELGTEKAYPRIRQWTPGDSYSEWVALLGPTDIHQPIQPTLDPVIHSISMCQISTTSNFSCRATALVGPEDHILYVTPDYAYLWMSNSLDELPWRWPDIDDCANDDSFELENAMPAALYRVPFSGGKPEAVLAKGTPTNQFSLSAQNDTFYSLVSLEPDDCWSYDGQWRLALASIPSAMFGTVPGVADTANFQELPKPDGYTQNRFAQGFLVYGGSQGVWHALYDHEDANYTVADVTVVALKHPAEYTTVMIPHSIERIDLFGPHVFVDGHITPNGLSASILNLRPVPTVTSSIFLNDVVETEDRSHAYNTRLHRDGSGLIGLPTIVRSEYLQDHETSTNLHFFRVDANLNLEVAGILQGDSRTVSPGYACEVSCTDWYGVSRPIFLGHRIFSLTDNELIEGTYVDGRISELVRLNVTGTPTNRR